MTKNYFPKSDWSNLISLESKSYICWNCEENISSNYGYATTYRDQAIYICHNCNAPTIFDYQDKNPIGTLPGSSITKMPAEIESIYNEARACISVGASTAAVMLFRKILMNLAVVEGAEEDKNFKYYVKYLCEHGFVHKRQTSQADKIRDLGNEANHQIESRTEEEAQAMLKFIEFLLLNNYEFADDEVQSIKT